MQTSDGDRARELIDPFGDVVLDMARKAAELARTTRLK
jgi:hypothetical protein